MAQVSLVRLPAGESLRVILRVDFAALELGFRKEGGEYRAKVLVGYELGGRSGWREFELRSDEQGEPEPRFAELGLSLPKSGRKVQVLVKEGKKVLFKERLGVKPLDYPLGDPILRPAGDTLEVTLVGEGVDSVRWRVEKLGSSVAWGSGETLSFKVPLKGVYPGERVLKVEAYSGGKLVARREAKFKRLGNFYLDPVHFKAILSALEFAYPGKVGELRKAVDRERAWKRFWREIDPSGEAERVFLERYAYAWERWRRFDGTLADMGKVYVKYGPPDWVERHPFELDVRPYEVWYYDRYGLSFIFVDRNGTGDYELVQPGFYNQFGY